MHSMKHFQDTRHEKALEKVLQNISDSGQENENLETLDVMTSL